MSNVLWRMGVLVLLVGVGGGDLRVRAEDRPEDSLTLKSGYSGKWLAGGARRVHLTVTLDRKGDGSGTLTLDPNVYEGEHGDPDRDPEDPGPGPARPRRRGRREGPSAVRIEALGRGGESR